MDIDKELSPSEAFEGMRELLCLSPEVGRPLIAHVISGFIRTAFREAGMVPRTVLVIEGKSGMLKSHYVPHITQLYNRADEIGCDTRFNSTQRFIEDTIAGHDECTVVIDDLHQYLKVKAEGMSRKYKFLIMVGEGETYNELPKCLRTRLKNRAHRSIYIELKYYKDGKGVIDQCYYYDRRYKRQDIKVTPPQLISCFSRTVKRKFLIC